MILGVGLTNKVAINKKDMDVIVGMYELMPDGKYFILGQSLHRASFAKDPSRRLLLRPVQKE